MTSRPDILDQMTKAELVTWIRKNCMFRMPRLSDVLFIRWQIKSEELQESIDAEMKHWESTKPDFKRRDELAKKFNASSDQEERWQLLQQMKPYDDAIAAHIKRTQVLDSRQDKVDLLYERINVELQKERRAMP